MSSSEIARQSVRASAILLAGSLISNGILLINALLVARLLGTNGYGTYSISLLLPTIFLVASGLGINTALTRFASYHRSRGEIEEAKRKTSNGIRFMIVLGTILTLCCYFSASFVAKNFFQRPMIVPLIQFASLTILGQIIFQSGVSSLVGWSMPKSAGAAYIIQAVVKISLAPLLIVAGLGVLGPLTAQVTGILIAAIFAIVVLQPILRGTKSSNSFRVFYKDIREAIKFGFPSEIGGYLANFGGQNYVVIILTIIVTSTNTIVGYFQAATNLTVLISIVSTSLNLSLFYGFSALHGKEGDTSKGFMYAVKYVGYFVTPFIFFLATASSPLIRIIYGRLYEPAAPLLSLIALSNSPMVIGQSVFPPYFNGIGRTKFTLIAFLVDAGASFILAPLLGFYLNRFGAYYSAIGITVSLLASNLASGLTALYLAKRYLRTEIDYRTSILILIISAICSAAAFLPFRFLSGDNGLLLNVAILLAQFAVFFGLYVILAPLLGVIKKDDILRLRSSSKDTGIARRTVSIILKIEEKIMAK